MKINKILFILLLLLFACPVLAQDLNSEMNTIQFGEYSVEYDSSEEVDNNHTVYKKEDKIVLSVFDTDGNNKDDLWLRYGEDFILDLEASDTTGDGQADTFISLNSEEDVMNRKTPEFKLKKVVLPQNPNPKQITKPIKPAESPAYFTLNPPPTENKFSFPIKWVALLILIGAIVYLKFKRKKKS